MGLFSRIGGEELPHGFNMRDLGGWNVQGLTGAGALRTQPFRLVRSGLLNRADHSELKEILRYGSGVKYVLDLRGAQELAEWPDVLASQHGIEYRNICLLDVDLSAGGSLASQMAHGYIHMLANAPAMYDIFTWIGACAQRGDGTFLYHCTGGMDRTGVLTMLLLGLAGVSRDDICRDYLRSFALWNKVEEALWAPAGTYGYDELTSRRDLFLKVYDDVVARFDGIDGYLLACGIPATTLESIARWMRGQQG